MIVLEEYEHAKAHEAPLHGIELKLRLGKALRQRTQRHHLRERTRHGKIAVRRLLALHSLEEVQVVSTLPLRELLQNRLDRGVLRIGARDELKRTSVAAPREDAPVLQMELRPAVAPEPELMNPSIAGYSYLIRACSAKAISLK